MDQVAATAGDASSGGWLRGLPGLYFSSTRGRLHGREQSVRQKLRIGFLILKFPPGEHGDQILLGGNHKHLVAPPEAQPGKFSAQWIQRPHKLVIDPFPRHGIWLKRVFQGPGRRGVWCDGSLHPALGHDLLALPHSTVQIQETDFCQALVAEIQASFGIHCANVVVFPVMLDAGRREKIFLTVGVNIPPRLFLKDVTSAVSSHRPDLCRHRGSLQTDVFILEKGVIYEQVNLACNA